MKRIEVHLKAVAARTYPILVQAGLLKQWVPERVHRLVILTDHTVKKHYGLALQRRLKKAGYITLLCAFKPGESSKNIETKCMLENKMFKAKCGRDTLILALGGGVVGDLAGFIAATYMRGVPFIQMPTTFLAMVDSSIGGKTGIDTPFGKNLIGAFWQPQAVIADLQCLKTLSQRQLIHGLVEAIKVFLVKDAVSLAYVQKHLDRILAYDEQALTSVLTRAVKCKAEIVEADEQEHGQRMVLNFGHTIGHALEQLSAYKLPHGEAVAYGMLVESKIAMLLGHLDPQQYEYIATLLARLKIVPKALQKFDVKAVIRATQTDKKKRAGHVNYVLLADMGRVVQAQGRFAHEVPAKIIKQAFVWRT